MSHQKTLDSFWIDLTLRHPQRDPDEFTQTLALDPYKTAKLGQSKEKPVPCLWTHHFREGFRETEFDQALEDFLSLLETHEDYLRDFTAEGGEIILGLNQNVGREDGAIFTLDLDAFFLNILGFHGVSLKIQAWSNKEDQTSPQ